MLTQIGECHSKLIYPTEEIVTTSLGVKGDFIPSCIHSFSSLIKILLTNADVRFEKKHGRNRNGHIDLRRQGQLKARSELSNCHYWQNIPWNWSTLVSPIQPIMKSQVKYWKRRDASERGHSTVISFPLRFPPLSHKPVRLFSAQIHVTSKRYAELRMPSDMWLWKGRRCHDSIINFLWLSRKWEYMYEIQCEVRNHSFIGGTSFQ